MKQELPYEIYHKHGIQFFYPDDWELEESVEDDTVNITLESPLTVSMTICVLGSRPQSEEVISQLMDVFESEYEEFDLYDSTEKQIGEFTMLCQEAEFVCHELINIVKCLAFRTEKFTIVILSQGYDQDMGQFGPTIEKITQSLSIENEDDKIHA